MGKLDGKVAFITGGARGIGACISDLFTSEGAAVLIVDLLETEGQETTENLLQKGRKAAFVQADVTDSAAMRTAVERAVDTFGRLDIVVADAGWMRHPANTATETNEEDFDRTYDINVKGVWLASKYCIPHLIRGGGGAIVNIASVYGHLGVPGRVAYGGSKAAVASMTRVLAVECGPANIRVNSISPGPIATPQLLKVHHSAGPNSDQALRDQCFPMRRLGRVVDVAAAALFLVSNDATWISGHDLIVDGGLSVQSCEPLMFPPFRELWQQAYGGT